MAPTAVLPSPHMVSMTERIVEGMQEDIQVLMHGAMQHVVATCAEIGMQRVRAMAELMALEFAPAAQAPECCRGGEKARDPDQFDIGTPPASEPGTPTLRPGGSADGALARVAEQDLAALGELPVVVDPKKLIRKIAQAADELSACDMAESCPVPASMELSRGAAGTDEMWQRRFSDVQNDLKTIQRELMSTSDDAGSECGTTRRGHSRADTHRLQMLEYADTPEEGDEGVQRQLLGGADEKLVPEASGVPQGGCGDQVAESPLAEAGHAAGTCRSAELADGAGCEPGHQSCAGTPEASSSLLQPSVAGGAGRQVCAEWDSEGSEASAAAESCGAGGGSESGHTDIPLSLARCHRDQALQACDEQVRLLPSSQHGLLPGAGARGELLLHADIVRLCLSGRFHRVRGSAAGKRPLQGSGELVCLDRGGRSPRVSRGGAERLEPQLDVKLLTCVGLPTLWWWLSQLLPTASTSVPRVKYFPAGGHDAYSECARSTGIGAQLLAAHCARKLPRMYLQPHEFQRRPSPSSDLDHISSLEPTGAGIKLLVRAPKQKHRAPQVRYWEEAAPRQADLLTPDDIVGCGKIGDELELRIKQLTGETHASLDAQGRPTYDERKKARPWHVESQPMSDGEPGAAGAAGDDRHHVYIWRVVGGQAAGGILVRSGVEFDSPPEVERLETGALLLQVELANGRLNYTLISGVGPGTGWVSVGAKGRILVVRTDMTLTEARLEAEQVRAQALRRAEEEAKVRKRCNEDVRASRMLQMEEELAWARAKIQAKRKSVGYGGSWHEDEEQVVANEQAARARLWRRLDDDQAELPHLGGGGGGLLSQPAVWLSENSCLFLGRQTSTGGGGSSSSSQGPWVDYVELQKSGLFRRQYSSTDGGRWSVQGGPQQGVLCLDWDDTSVDLLEVHDGGLMFESPGGTITLISAMPLPPWFTDLLAGGGQRSPLQSMGRPGGRPSVAIVVPFRPQPLQDRGSQLRAMQQHFCKFLDGAGLQVFMLVVQQSEDRLKFNRGQLLNAGFREAQKFVSSVNPAGALASVIFHDCDLLPPAELLPWYLNPPVRGKPAHLLAPGLCKSQKYAQNDQRPGCQPFFGGVAVLHPADFEACNGFPNDLWGWCHEDDQLLLRLEAAGVLDSVMRPADGVGEFVDLDPINNSDVLAKKPTYALSKLVNEYALSLSLELDPNWAEGNGLAGLQYQVLEHTVSHLGVSSDAAAVALVHVCVELTEVRWERPVSPLRRRPAPVQEIKVSTIDQPVLDTGRPAPVVPGPSSEESRDVASAAAAAQPETGANVLRFHPSWRIRSRSISPQDVRYELSTFVGRQEINFTVIDPLAAYANGSPVAQRERRVLLIFLHGYGNAHQRLAIPQDSVLCPWFAHNTIILCPASPADSWWFLNHGEVHCDEPWVSAPWDHKLSAAYCSLVSQALENMPVLPKALLTGNSMGGNGAWMLAAENPALFGAVVVVASYLREEYHAEIAERLVHVPILCVHCLGDLTCPIQEIEQICTKVHIAKSVLSAREPLRTIFLSDIPEYEAGFHNYWGAFFGNLSLLRWCTQQVEASCADAEPPIQREPLPDMNGSLNS